MESGAYRDAFVRAAYRGILGREPEQAVLTKQLPLGDTPPEFERDAERLLREFLRSGEYLTLLAKGGRSEFALGSWVIADLKSGIKLWLDLGDYGVSRQCLNETYEPIETTFLRNTIRPGMSFVDIGANIGWFALNGAKWVGPNGRVTAFEPREDTFARLSASSHLNGFEGWVDTHNVALGAEEGFAALGCDAAERNSGGTWLLPTAALRQQFEAGGAILRETPVTTLDRVMAGRRVDVIKIDIEGAEPLAIEGAKQTIAKWRPTILSEVNYEVLPIVAQKTGAEYMAMMAGLGYVAHRIENGAAGQPVPLDGAAPESGVANYAFVPASAKS